MILIYSHTISNRLEYIAHVIFCNVLKFSTVHFTTDIDEFEKFNGVKICYSNEALSSGLFIASNHLLFENSIEIQDIDVVQLEKYKVFFQTNHKDSIFSFDVFSASFFLVSRYEEYLPFNKDKYGRFSAKESIAYKNNFLDKPLVNMWAVDLLSTIQKYYPTYSTNKLCYNFIPTIDVDNAFAYKNKGLLRTTLGAIKSFLFNSKDLKERIAVLLNKKQDPYDAFDYLHTLHQKIGLNPIFFWLLGDYAMYDKNISHTNSKLIAIIKNAANKYKVGIHPSYASNREKNKLALEIKRLEQITEKKITDSRQHFLMLKFPETFEQLIANNILDDFSMGYSDENGFRASICNSFKFYNLAKEQVTNLTVHPFAIMETTFLYYKKYSTQEAIKEIDYYIATIREVKGTFIPVWHNESLSETGKWKGWREVYEYLLKAAH